jgi:hypothetical protein
MMRNDAWLIAYREHADGFPSNVIEEALANQPRFASGTPTGLLMLQHKGQRKYP